MCGIIGIVHERSGLIDSAILKRCNDLIAHRGPDDEGFYLDDYAGLAMRRLSIIDLATGHQPISNSQGTTWIVFNGEIYNYKELRPELEAAGYSFKTQSDTEIILALYEKMGRDCVKKLRGMFAFAIWDRPRKRLILGRDRVGKKPLFIAQGPGFLAFASEPRSLLEWSGVSREVDPVAVDLFLSLQYIPGPQTIYKEVRKIPPAHTLVWEKGRVSIERYWDLPLDAPPVTQDQNEAKALLRRTLEDAVRLRLVSEVPLGAFLSGGIDSSLVVAMMSRLSRQPVKTFSIGFEEEEFSELAYARQVATAYGCDHHEFIVKPDMADVLPKLAWHYGEPFADASALPSFYVARETRKHVTVALNGDGGDELFAGYVRYFAMKAARYYDVLPDKAKRLLLAGADRFPDKDAPYSVLWRTKRFMRSGMSSDLAARHLHMIGYFQDEDKQGLYAPALKQSLGVRDERDIHRAREYLAAAFARCPKEDFVNRLLYVDTNSYLSECLLPKMDIATMANSLEGRSPFLDHVLMETAFRLPGDWKLKGLKGHKWILKEAFKDLLPIEIRKRKKMGFGVPVGLWFRGRLKDYWRDHVLSPRALARGYFQAPALNRLWDEHQSGLRDHGYRLWALLMLELWHQSCLDGVYRPALDHANLESFRPLRAT